MPDLDIIEINDKLAYDARQMASSMSEPQIRKRGMIDMLGINCAISYMQAKKLRIDTKRSVYKIPLLFEEFKIADIYYNNYRINVITLYREKTIKVPKIHMDIDIMPDFYFVVQIGTRIKEAKMIGFIDAKSVLGCSCDSKYYYPTLDLIFDLKKFIQITKRSTPTRTQLGKHADCLGLFLKFIDDDLSNIYKSQLIQHLMNCDSCRGRFIDAIEFEKIANSIRHYPKLAQKYEYKIKANDTPQTAQREYSIEEGLNKTEIEEEVLISEEIEPQNIDFKEQELYKQDDFNHQDTPVNLNQSKKVIDTIFNEMRNIELPQIKTIIKSKHRHAIIAIAIMFTFLIGFALISIRSASHINSENANLDEIQNNFPDDMENVSDFGTLYDEDDYNPTHEARLISKQKDVSEFSIQQPIPSKPTYSPSVANVSWEVPESLVKKQNYTKFLQSAGKNIKLNLQNDLLLVNDIPINRLVSVNIKIASNGDIQSVEMNQTSGSNPIDTSIKRVVKDTLKFMRPPAHGIIARPVEVSLTIELK